MRATVNGRKGGFNNTHTPLGGQSSFLLAVNDREIR